MLELLSTFNVLALSAATVVIYKVYLHTKARNGLPYPPGPKAAYPIIGNLLDLPKDFQWITYAEWGRQYGGIVYLNLFGQHLVIINSEEVANDLLEKRSRNYSDRPDYAVMLMNGWKFHTGMKHYNYQWRRDRRILHQKFGQQAAASLHPLQVAKSRVLLHNLLRAPEDFVHHLELYPASTIMYILYGHEVVSHNDPLISLTLESISLASGLTLPGTAVVSAFPPLRHLPTWFPGLRELHRHCSRCRDLLKQMQDIPVDSVKRHIAEGTAVHCLVSELLERNKMSSEEHIPEQVIKEVGASTFSAAIETTLTVLRIFLLAMILYPEAQDRAQAEIDSVIGNDRLPTHDDRDSLPYVDALFRELFRWHGPNPLSIPHATLEDDVYNGYYIPKGAMIITNQWAMCHDESVYPNPEAFRPERFLSSEGSLSDQFPPTWGFGRRACVGKSMGDASVWIAIVSILSVFRVAKAKDKSGNDIEVSEEFDSNIVSSPLPFKCSITPRSEAAKTLIIDNPPMKLDSNPMFY